MKMVITVTMLVISLIAAFLFIETLRIQLDGGSKAHGTFAYIMPSEEGKFRYEIQNFKKGI